MDHAYAGTEALSISRPSQTAKQLTEMQHKQEDQQPFAAADLNNVLLRLRLMIPLSFPPPCGAARSLEHQHNLTVQLLQRRDPGDNKKLLCNNSQMFVL